MAGVHTVILPRGDKLAEERNNVATARGWCDVEEKSLISIYLDDL